jgi:hypothetical protein
MRPNHDRMDEWLDQALRQSGEVEPRSGLENRLLANLRSERVQRAVYHRWWWAAVALATVAVVIARWLGSRAGVPTQVPDLANAPVARAPSPALRTVVVTPPSTTIARKLHRTKPVGRNARATRKELTPKLAQFPSPKPLSEQEELLIRYVREHREEAVFVAQARAELSRQERDDELGPDVEPKNSHEHER